MLKYNSWCAHMAHWLPLMIANSNSLEDAELDILLNQFKASRAMDKLRLEGIENE